MQPKAGVPQGDGDSVEEMLGVGGGVFGADPLSSGRYTIERTYPREFAFVYTQKRKCSFLRAYACVCVCAFACVRLRACLRADLIKTQNAFARKIFQHSNALWVQKLSGCTIY